MKTRQITIAGKTITIAYCYATEIAFKNFSGIDFVEFRKQTQTEGAASPQLVLYAILSAITAYDQGTGAKKQQMTDKDIMFSASPKELIDALTAVMELRNEWYQIPSGEPEDKTAEGEDNAKN